MTLLIGRQFERLALRVPRDHSVRDLDPVIRHMQPEGVLLLQGGSVDSVVAWCRKFGCTLHFTDDEAIVVVA